MVTSLIETDNGTLVSRAAAGEPRAWDDLIDRFSGMVLSVARRRGLNPTDAADVSQTVWMRLFEHLTRIQHPERVAGWLATTTQRESERFQRDARRVVLVDDDLALEPEWPAAGADAAILSGELAGRLAAAYEELPARCWRLLVLLYDEEPISYKEVSATLQIPAGSIGPTRHRCLECLRALFEAAEDPE